MRGAFWWIDRWRQSRAFTDMTAEEQGLYRNLCDELWLRDDHVIPDDPRVLSRVSGDPEAWKRCGNKVLRWMKRVPEGWTNETALEIIEQSKKRAARQAAYRERSGNPVAKTPAERRAKDAARSAVSRAIASGALVRQPCVRCGVLEVQAHHEDYSKPLDVIWLCKPDHDELHNNRRVESDVTRTGGDSPHNVRASPFTVSGSVSVSGAEERPPLPPRDAGGAVAGRSLVDLAADYVVETGGRAWRPVRRRLKEWAKAGMSLEEIKGHIDAGDHLQRPPL